MKEIRPTARKVRAIRVTSFDQKMIDAVEKFLGKKYVVEESYGFDISFSKPVGIRITDESDLEETAGMYDYIVKAKGEPPFILSRSTLYDVYGIWED